LLDGTRPIWQVADGNSRFYSLDNPKVTITRGMLGAFYLNLMATTGRSG
jgi:hypothetical protein